MSRLFLDSTFKLHKANSILKGLSQSQTDELSIIISKLLYQQLENNASSLLYNDLITYNNWRDVQKELSITFKGIQRDIHGLGYNINYLIIKHQNRHILTRQLIIFMNKNQGNDKEFNSLVLIKANMGISHLIINYLEDSNIIIKNLKLSNDIVINSLNKIINLMKSTIAILGNIEITFNIETLNNSLNHLSISVPNQYIKNFIKEKDTATRNLVDNLYTHISKKTSISLEKLKVSKMQCGVIIISSDGKLKLLSNGLNLSNSEDVSIVYDILADIYDSKYSDN